MTTLLLAITLFAVIGLYALALVYTSRKDQP